MLYCWEHPAQCPNTFEACPQGTLPLACDICDVLNNNNQQEEEEEVPGINEENNEYIQDEQGDIDEGVDDLFFDSQYDFEQEAEPSPRQHRTEDSDVPEARPFRVPTPEVDVFDSFDLEKFFIKTAQQFENQQPQDDGTPQEPPFGGDGWSDNAVDLVRPTSRQSGVADHHERQRDEETNTTTPVRRPGRVGSPSTYEPISPGSPIQQPEGDDGGDTQLPTGPGASAFLGFTLSGFGPGLWRPGLPFPHKYLFPNFAKRLIPGGDGRFEKKEGWVFQQ
jgi:hypothetical protein